MAGITNRHMSRRAISKPGVPNRVWRCDMCGATGQFDDLSKIKCTYVYKPCRYCGSTGPDGDCALDCAGIAAALGAPSVHVVGMKKPKLPRA